MTLQELEQRFYETTEGNGKPNMGSSGRDWTGVPFSEVSQRSECDMMKWCHDNSGLRFKPFFELDYETPLIGARIFNSEGVLVKTYKRTPNGGRNGKPSLSLRDDMYAIINLCVEYVHSLQA